MVIKLNSYDDEVIVVTLVDEHGLDGLVCDSVKIRQGHICMYDEDDYLRMIIPKEFESDISVVDEETRVVKGIEDDGD